MQTKDKFFKLLSGRLWLTIISGISFLLFVLTICQLMYIKRDIVTVSEMTSIINMLLLVISNIFTFYFTKERTDDKTKSLSEQLKELSQENQNKTE